MLAAFSDVKPHDPRGPLVLIIFAIRKEAAWKKKRMRASSRLAKRSNGRPRSKTLVNGPTGD